MKIIINPFFFENPEEDLRELAEELLNKSKEQYYLAWGFLFSCCSKIQRVSFQMSSQMGCVNPIMVKKSWSNNPELKLNWFLDQFSNMKYSQLVGIVHFNENEIEKELEGKIKKIPFKNSFYYLIL